MGDIAVAKRSAIAPGTMLRVVVGATPILICDVGGTLYAVADLCTHDGGALDGGELEGERVMCPRHGAYFDVMTGRALTLPAIVPLPTYPVRLDGDNVYIDVAEGAT